VNWLHYFGCRCQVHTRVGGVIRVGDKYIYLPDKSADPRAVRRKRRLPPGRALLPFNPQGCSEHQWEASIRGAGAYGDAVARDWGEHLQAQQRTPSAAPAAGRPESTFSVLSYQVLSQERASSLANVKSSLLRAAPRRERLLSEILNYDADVICLQDVDNYVEFWEPKLNGGGYDSLFKQKTSQQRPRSSLAEGCLVAWQRDQFNLVRSQTVELNDQYEEVKSRDTSLAMECMNDDVAVMCHLSPWQDGWHPAPLCVVSVMLKEGGLGSEGDDSAGVNKCENARAEQARYLTRCVERFNADLSAPVVLCGGFETPPYSKTYDILANGSLPLDPGPPKKPGHPPLAKVSSSTSVRLRWKAPQLDFAALDPPIEGYLVGWRAGGHRNLGFKEQTYVAEGDAIVYELVPDESGGHGGARTVRNEYLCFTIAGLSSSTAYEFRFCAVNELGSGPWSEPSVAVQCPQMGDNAAPFTALLNIDQWMLRLGQGNLSLQALLIAAKQANLVNSEDVARMRAEIRDGLRSEFYFVQETLKLLRDAKQVSAAHTRKILSEFEAAEGNGKSNGKSNGNGKSSALSSSCVDDELERKQAHTFGSPTNLTPRYADSGAPASLLASVRTQNTSQHFTPHHTASGFALGTEDQRGSSSSSSSIASSSIANGGGSGGGGGGFNAQPQPSAPSLLVAQVEAQMRRDQRHALAALGASTQLPTHSAPQELGPTSGKDRNSSSSSSSSSGNGAAVAMTAATATKATMGLADARQQHRLRLSSAYGSYSWEGEPPLTCVTPSYVGTCDYLLYSAEKLVRMEASMCRPPPRTIAHRGDWSTFDVSTPCLHAHTSFSSSQVPATLLSLPELDDFVNDDPSALEMTADESLGSDPPHGWNADFQSANASTAAANNPLSYSGTWAGGVKENEHKTHHCLPNAEFGSTHLALFAEFRFLKQGIASDWTEAVESAVPSAEEKEAQGTADGKGTGAGFSAVGSSFETTETDGAEEL